MKNIDLIKKFVGGKCRDGLKCNNLKVEFKSGKVKTLRVLINYGTIIAYATTRTAPCGTLDIIVLNRHAYSRTTCGIVNKVEHCAITSMDFSYEIISIYNEENFNAELNLDLDNKVLDLDGNVLK